MLQNNIPPPFFPLFFFNENLTRKVDVLIVENFFFLLFIVNLQILKRLSFETFLEIFYNSSICSIKPYQDRRPIQLRILNVYNKTVFLQTLSFIVDFLNTTHVLKDQQTHTHILAQSAFHINRRSLINITLLRQRFLQFNHQTVLKITGGAHTTTHLRAGTVSLISNFNTC